MNTSTQQASVDRGIRDLQKDITDGMVTVSVLLRRALVLARAKMDTACEAWIRKELDGYAGPASQIPDYRTIHGVLHAWNPYRGWMPVQFVDPGDEKRWSSRACNQSIQVIESLLGDPRKASKPFHMPVNPEAAALLAETSNYPNPRYTHFISSTDLDGMLCAVRNRLLDWTMQFDLKDASEEKMSRRDLEELMRDRLSFLKADGKRIRDNIKAVVDPAKGQITTFDVDLPVSEGDFFERTLPNKLVERYEVLEPGYHAGLEGIPASFHVRVRKVVDRPRPAPPPTSITIHGDNARVNMNSIDQSTNASSRTTVDWTNLQATIERELPEPARSQLAKAVAGMKEAAGKPSFKDRYKEFMTQAANHMTVLSPFIPALLALL